MATHQGAVADRLHAARDREHRRVRRLVGRVVVAGEPPRRDLRLPHRDRARAGLRERRLTTVRQVHRLAAIGHCDRCAVTAREEACRTHDQLVFGLVEGGAVAVDGHRRRTQQQVQVEPAEPLLRDEGDGRLAGQGMRGGVPGRPDRVVPDLVAGVTGTGEVRVADPCLGTCGGGKAEGLDRPGGRRPLRRCPGDRRRRATHESSQDESCRHGQDGAQTGHRPNDSTTLAPG